MGTLAEVGPQRGLPRGRGSLPAAEVARAQRERMLRAMTSAVADLGYANVRVADVVDRARVSRQSFYEQFDGKEECFLAAHAEGVEVILARLAEAAGGEAGAGRGGDPRLPVRTAIRAYLALAAEEPEFARCMLIELPATGPAGLEARVAAHRQIAAVLQLWHRQARRGQRDWPAVPAHRYAAAVGGVHDLLFAAVAAGRPEDLAGLEDAAVDAVLALLEIPTS